MQVNKRNKYYLRHEIEIKMESNFIFIFRGLVHGRYICICIHNQNYEFTIK